MIKVLSAIATFIYLIPFILGLSKYPFLTKRERRFFYFITVSTLCSLLAYFTSYVGNNLYVAYIFNAAEIIMVPLFLLNIQDIRKLKWGWVACLIVGFSLIFYEAFVKEGGFSMYNSLSLTYAALGLSILSIRNLLKLRFDPSIFDLSKSSVFWFTLGLGIYYLGSILIFAFMRLFQEQETQTLINVYTFRLVIMILSILLMAWGFLIIKTNTRTLASKP